MVPAVEQAYGPEFNPTKAHADLGKSRVWQSAWNPRSGEVERAGPLGLASLAKSGSSGSVRDPSQRVSWRLMATAGMHTAYTIC